MNESDILRLNLYCYKIQNEETFNFWKIDRNEFQFKNFPDQKKYDYIEENTPEVIFLLIKNTKNFLYYFIRKKFELNIQNVSANKEEITDFIRYIDEITYTMSLFFQMIDYRTGLPSNSYVRATVKIELLPSCWIEAIVFEIITYKNNKKIFLDSIYRVETIYESDEERKKKSYKKKKKYRLATHQPIIDSDNNNFALINRK
jgi:hypothetical protein